MAKLVESCTQDRLMKDTELYTLAQRITNLIPLFGIKGLADYETKVYNCDLKKNDEFLHQFNQITGMNLKTVDTAVTFFKELLDTANISYLCGRSSKSTYFQLANSTDDSLNIVPIGQFLFIKGLNQSSSLFQTHSIRDPVRDPVLEGDYITDIMSIVPSYANGQYTCRCNHRITSICIQTTYKDLNLKDDLALIPIQSYSSFKSSINDKSHTYTVVYNFNEASNVIDLTVESSSTSSTSSTSSNITVITILIRYVISDKLHIVSSNQMSSKLSAPLEQIGNTIYKSNEEESEVRVLTYSLNQARYIKAIHLPDNSIEAYIVHKGKILHYNSNMLLFNKLLYSSCIIPFYDINTKGNAYFKSDEPYGMLKLFVPINQTSSEFHDSLNNKSPILETLDDSINAETLLSLVSLQYPTYKILESPSLITGTSNSIYYITEQNYQEQTLTHLQRLNLNVNTTIKTYFKYIVYTIQPHRDVLYLVNDEYGKFIYGMQNSSIEINSLYDFLKYKLPHVIDIYLNSSKLIAKCNNDQANFDKCKFVERITVEYNKPFQIPCNRMIKYLNFNHPILIKSVEFLVGGQVINQWHSNFTKFNQPIPVLLGLHNKSMYGYIGLEHFKFEIRLIKYDDNQLIGPNMTCILDIYEAPVLSEDRSVTNSNPIVPNIYTNELMILRNEHAEYNVTNFLADQCCFQLDISSLPTVHLKTKFIAKNPNQSVIINEVVLKLSLNSRSIMLPLTKSDEQNVWQYDFMPKNVDSYYNKFPILSDKYTAILIINGNNYQKCHIEQITCNVLRFVQGMAGLGYL